LALLVKLKGEYKNCEWVDRFLVNPGMPRSGIVPPTPDSAPGSALKFTARRDRPILWRKRIRVK
jgi:hypothetical protein